MFTFFKQVLGSRERLLCFFFRSVVIVFPFLFHPPPLGRLVAQAEMVPAEGTPTIKSVRVSALACQSL